MELHKSPRKQTKKRQIEGKKWSYNKIERRIDRSEFKKTKERKY